MGSGANQSPDEMVAREMQALLVQIDAELTRLAADPSEFEARVERAKRLLAEPCFLAGPKDPSHRPSPLVSVVLPTRDRAAFVGEAIASVQAQSFTNWELIVVDDGSQDGTADVVAAFLRDDRVRYVSQEPAGHATARNRAVCLSRGELIAYIDSDNLWFPNFLAAAVVALASLRDADCVYGALVTEAHFAPPRTLLFEEFDWGRLLTANYIDLNTVVHRKTLTETYGGFDERLNRLVDWDLLLRFTQDKPARRVPVLAARYRVVDDQRVTAICPVEPNYSTIRSKWPEPVE